MISLTPEALAKEFIERKGVYDDPIIAEVRDFTMNQEITTGTSYVSFKDINNYFIQLVEDTFKHVQKQMSEQSKPKSRRKSDDDVDEEIRLLLNEKDNRFIFKINPYTKYLGIEIKTLRYYIGYSKDSRRPLGISTLDIGTYHCFSDADSIYLPVMHLQHFLEDVVKQARTRKTKKIAFLFMKSLDPLFELQEKIEKMIYPIHDMKLFNKVRDQIKEKMLSHLGDK